MIEYEDLYIHNCFFKVVTRLYFLPFCFNSSIQRLRACKNRWRKPINLGYTSISLLHTMYIVSQTVMYLFVSNEQSPRIPLMLICSLASVGLSIHMYIVCIKYPETQCILFNELMVPANERGSRGKVFRCSNVVASNNRKPKDFITKYFPLINYPVSLTFLALYVVDTVNPLLLLACIPHHWINPVTVGLGLTLETTAMLTKLTSVHLSVYFCLMFTDRTTHQLRNEVTRLRVSQNVAAEVLEQTVKEMETLSLGFSLFTQLFSTSAFIGKVMAIGMSVFSGFGIVRFIRGYPVYGVIYIVMLLNAVTLYIGVTLDTYKMTNGMDQLKLQMLASTKKMASQTKRKEMELRIRAMPRMRFKMSSFNYLERESVLLFLGFVVQNIVSLLVSFPQS